MSGTAADSQKGTNVKVVVRCRPLNAEEKRTGQPIVVSCDNSTNVTISYGNTIRKAEKTFSFDKVFGTYSTQEEVFDSIVRPIVEEALDGFNCTVFAYGQTGTGKTHTMEGDITNPEKAGIVPRCVKTIFEHLGERNTEFTVRVSFLELYNEELQDLLSTDTEKKLRLCEDVKKGLVCQNLEEVAVLNVDDIFDILQKGIKLRQTAETMCNKNSSRSHTIFTMKLFVKESTIDGEEVVRMGQLNLVDLAGSECIGRSGAKHQQAREAGNINQSLLTLGRVITALVEHQPHVPYRDSKLTRLLQDSLGGKAKTCIIATFSPSQLAVEETLSTLDYAYRAKNIKNAPQQNQKLVTAVHLKEYSAEIESLRAQLQITREKNGVYLDPKDFYAMENKIASLTSQLSECEGSLKVRSEEVKLLRVSGDHMELKIQALSQTLEATTMTLNATTLELEDTKRELTATHIELEATECVVTEQAVIENSLRADAQELQQEVTHCRASIINLQEKLDEYAAKQAQSLSRCDGFVENMSVSHKNLLSSIEALVEDSDKSAALVCDGISVLLTSGRSTCTTLQAAVDRAMNSLVGAVTESGADVTNGLSELRSHVYVSRDGIISQISDLKEELSSAILSMNSSIATVDQLLTEGSTKISLMTEEIRRDAHALTESSVSSKQAQEKLLTKAGEQVLQLKGEVAMRTAQYEGLLRTMTEAQTAMLQAQADKIKETVDTLMQELVAKQSTAMSESTKASSEYTATVENSISAFETAERLTAAQQAAVIASSHNAAQALLGTMLESVKVEEDAFSRLSSKAQHELGRCQLSGTQAQSRLSEVTADVHRDVVTATEATTAAIDSSLSALETIVSDVAQASTAMGAEVSEALTAFVASMDSDGDAAKDCAVKHFHVASASLLNQRADTVAMHSHVTAFSADAKENVVQHRGSTPAKAPFKPLAILCAASDLDAVKMNARARLSAAVIATSPEASPKSTGTGVTPLDITCFKDRSSIESKALTPVSAMSSSDSENCDPQLSFAETLSEPTTAKAARPRSKSISRLRQPSSR